MFNIDFDILINRNLPTWKSLPKVRAWLRCLIKPLVRLYYDFLDYREAVLLEISYNGQTMVLERMLNINFPNTNSSIFIENTSNSLPSSYLYYLHEDQEAPPIYYKSENIDDEGYLYFESEYQQTYDFIVWVPSSLVFNQTEMRAKIDLYKIAGKRYIIQTF
jgi:hypothetical protein